MGKAARQKNRELQDQAAVAIDLNMLKTRPFLIAGFQVDALDMMTPLGKSPGVRLTFHMQNGDIHTPIIFDPIMGYKVIAAIAMAISSPSDLGRSAPEPPVAAGVTPSDEADIDGTNTTPSGLIIP